MLTAVAAVLMTACSSAALADEAVTKPGAVEIVGHAIPRSLTGTAGDVARGAGIVFARESGNCILCHVVSDPRGGPACCGDLGPPLANVAARLSEGQVRLRLVDGRKLNAATIMPSYYRLDGLTRVGAAYQSKTVLSAQEIEDVIAFVMTLKE